MESSTVKQHGVNSFPMEKNKYKSLCPAGISLPNNTYQPYNRMTSEPSPATHDVISTLSKMNHRVSKDGFYVPSPALTSYQSQFNFYPEHSYIWNNNNFSSGIQYMNQQLPDTTPLTPSCAYYKTDEPIFGYPIDLLPPTAIFSASIAHGLMEEEDDGCDEGYTTINDESSPIQELRSEQPRSHDITSILSLPLDTCDDLFQSVCVYGNISLPPYPNITEDYRPDNKDMQRLFEVANASNKQPSDDVAQMPSVHKTIVTKIKNRKRHECDVCSKTFNMKSALTTHRRIHTGERPFGCEVCGRCFSDNSTYIKHVRIHTKVKPYSCGACGKSFSQSGNLNRHKKIHNKLNI